MTRAVRDAVVIDTNVLVSAFLSPFGNEAQVLDGVRKGRINPCISSEIIAEYAEVLTRKKFSFPVRQVQMLLQMLHETGAMHQPAPLPGASPDAGDDCFIACALASRAQFIITGNKRHFPIAACGDCKVVSAREYLEISNS